MQQDLGYNSQIVRTEQSEGVCIVMVLQANELKVLLFRITCNASCLQVISAMPASWSLCHEVEQAVFLQTSFLCCVSQLTYDSTKGLTSLTSVSAQMHLLEADGFSSAMKPFEEPDLNVVSFLFMSQADDV